MCRYGNEPAQRFILRKRGSAWVLTGCSGHGFKFGPLMGEALAEAATGRRDPAVLARWAAGED
jgi:glycine/D-amino acid oxidase-like deaminating enzyme